MNRYAENTSVATDRSRAEIEKTLVRYGADTFMYGWEDGRAVIGFRANGRLIRFELPIPDKNDREFTETATGRPRKDPAAYEAWEQAGRQRWRALALAVKAKLEAVAAGITTFDEEFLAHIVMPDGQTVGTWAAPQLERMYTGGQMPKLLPMLSKANA